MSLNKTTTAIKQLKLSSHSPAQTISQQDIVKPHRHDNYSTSILISVYNGDKTLNKALLSLSNQTTQNFVVVAVNDASTDKTKAILTKWQSIFHRKRFIIIKNKHNLGLTKSLNRGLQRCKTKYVARIDADDTWTPEKLSLQINFLEKNPHIGVLGSWYTNVTNNSLRNFNLPITNTSIKRNMFRINPFGHSCVVIRKNLLDQVGGYNTNIKYSQDRDLWFKLMNLTKFQNIPIYLCRRQTINNLSNLKSRQQMWQSLKTRLHYSNKYHAPLYTYLFLILPLLIILKPRFLFTTKAQPQETVSKLLFYSSLRGTARRQSNLSALNTLTASHKQNLLFINDRPLVSHRAETTARQAMAKAFFTHAFINKISITNTSPLKSLLVNLPNTYQILYLRCGSLASAIIALKLFFTSRTLILEVHNLDSNKINYIASWLYRIAAKRIDLLVTIDPISTNAWIKFGVSPDNILCLPSATPSPTNINKPTKSILLKKYSLPLNHKLIVYTGNLYRHRDIESILQSAHTLLEKPYSFVIAGGGTQDIKYYRQYLKTKYTQLHNVHFLGHLPHSQAISLINIADLILVTYSKHCPTVNTMSPIKLMEALSSGNRILAADLLRIRSLAHGSNINYYQPDKSQDLTKQIIRTLSHKNTNQTLPNTISFTWENRVNAILNKFLP